MPWSDANIGKLPNPEKPCSDCGHSEWVHHYDDIDRDVYGCKKFNMYDDDVRFFGDCGLEGKHFKKKRKRIKPINWFWIGIAAVTLIGVFLEKKKK